jgi:hypothetical protein
MIISTATRFYDLISIIPIDSGIINMLPELAYKFIRPFFPTFISTRTGICTIKFITYLPDIAIIRNYKYPLSISSASL